MTIRLPSELIAIAFKFPPTIEGLSVQVRPLLKLIQTLEVSLTAPMMLPSRDMVTIHQFVATLFILLPWSSQVLPISELIQTVPDHSEASMIVPS